MGFFSRTKMLIIQAVLAAYCFGSCSREDKSDNHISQKNPINIPVSIQNENSGLKLGGNSSSLGLVSIGTNLQVSVSGCATGYTLSTAAINSGTVKLYNGDKDCVVKLQSFTFGSTSYSATANGATNFSAWTSGSVATFANTSSATDLIKVYVQTQVTASGVLNTDTVAYTFTDIQAATADTLAKSGVQTGVPLSVTGAASPNFTIYQSRFLSTNSNGSANMSFTLQCGATLQGLSSDYSCSGSYFNNMDYILITDTYSQGAITVSQANTAFASNTPTSIGSLVVGPGNSDLNSNTLTKGGFYTSNSSPLVTANSIYSSSLNNVLFLRLKDGNGNTLSYLYFYVDVASLAQNTPASTCGTTFLGGAGTASNPYTVSTASQLSSLNTGACASNSVYFYQTADINLGGSSTPWTPVALTGQYNGGGHTISNMYINTGTTNSNLGLFSTINSGASVSNLNVSNVNLTGTSTAGALAGTSSGTVSNCTSSGTIVPIDISVSSGFGGLIGEELGGTISNSSSSVSINFTPSSSPQINGFLNFSLGGLVGEACASITNSYATGNITSSSGGSYASVNSGGLVGYIGDCGSSAPTISNSYATGTQNHQVNIVLSTNDASLNYGGLVGRAFLNGNGPLTISQTFANETLSSSSTTNDMGGLVGIIGGPYSNLGYYYISNSYAFGTQSITGSSGTAAGLIGYAGGANSNYVTVENSYSAVSSLSAPTVVGFMGNLESLDVLEANYMYVNGNVPSQTVSGLTTYTTATQMQTQTNFFFDFLHIWSMPTSNPLATGGLLSPVLTWQCGTNGIVCSANALSYFNGGDGSLANPFQISNSTQLENIAFFINEPEVIYYIQTSNIDLGGSSTPWTPIPFAGQYNGNGYTISNLYVNNTSAAALFTILSSGSSISNVILSNVNLTSTGSIGALVAQMSGGTISNCSASGTINSSPNTSSVGGIVGEMDGGTITSCSSSINISITPTTLAGFSSIGGLIGQMCADSSITLSSSSTTGNISSSSGRIGGATAEINIGNLIGVISDCNSASVTITNSYATGNQTHAMHVQGNGAGILIGGLIGYSASKDANFSGLFTVGTLSIVSTNTATIWMGGLMGYWDGVGSIANSYTMSTLSVTGVTHSGHNFVAGFIARIDDDYGNLTVSDSYSAVPSISGSGLSISGGFEADDEGIDNGTPTTTLTNVYLYANGSVPTQTLTGLTSYTTATQMQTQGNFTGFDFTTPVWIMPTANALSPSSLLSPVLDWQCGSNGIVCH